MPQQLHPPRPLLRDGHPLRGACIQVQALAGMPLPCRQTDNVPNSLSAPVCPFSYQLLDRTTLRLTSITGTALPLKSKTHSLSHRKAGAVPGAGMAPTQGVEEHVSCARRLRRWLQTQHPRALVVEENNRQLCVLQEAL